MNNISIDDLRNLVDQMKIWNGFIDDNTVQTVYAEPIAILTDIWNYAHELGHSDEQACAEADAESHAYTFAEVVKARNRMCDETDCKECPLNGQDCCEFAYLHSDDKIAEFENCVMSWAETHPEMRYPTFNEWQKENFPESIHKFTQCDFIQFKCPEHGDCSRCCDAEIPESIAVKLGIQKRPK